MTIVNHTTYLDFKYAHSPSGRPWHYVKRTNDNNKHDSAVVITTIIKKDDSYNFLFLKTRRPPIYGESKAKYCLESPAGLIGDVNNNESLVECTKKELLEETGYCADKIIIELTNSSSSAGLTSETISYVTAFINTDTIINNPLSDGGIIVDRILVQSDKILDYLNNLNKNDFSIASSLICGLFFAMRHLS